MAKIWKYSEPVVLASASPRRKDLLAEICDDMTVLPSDVDESAVVKPTPRALVKALSALKAEWAAARKDCVGKTVIGADTVVYLRKTYGKPRDFDDAVAMLTELSGKEHYVYTGVTVIRGGVKKTFSVRSAVTLKKMTREEIREYVVQYAPYDKAGAYAVQEGVLVQTYRGSYTNIVGLPLERLSEILRKSEV